MKPPHRSRASSFLLALAVVPATSLPTVAWAQAAGAAVSPAIAAGLVRTYFDALRRQDAGRLDGVTVGHAATQTREMLAMLKSEARRHRVRLELRVKELRIQPADPSDCGTGVQAHFDIAVVARKWLFSQVARVLTGDATFYVGGNLARGDTTSPKIIGLLMRFD